MVQENIVFTENKAKTVLLLTFVALTICSFILIPYTDSYYYWDWGRHLALSYYDGPPFIAYVMYLFTCVFGSTIFTINFLGVVSIYLTLWFIYQTAALLFDARIALNACLLWLFSTPVLHYLFLWVTYDNPLNFFWAATIYYVIRYTQYHKNLDLYWIGFFSGCMLLSKYTGVILLSALIFFSLLVPRYRALYRNPHFYSSILLTTLICSPIIIWNHQHQWTSFIYLFSYHTGTHGYHSAPLAAFLKYFIKIIKTYDILLLLPFYAIYKSFKSVRKNDGVLLLHIISCTFLGFLLILSFKNSISKHWLTPFTISSAILCSYYFVKLRLRKLFLLTISLYICWGIYYLTANSLLQKFFDEDYFIYSLIKDAGDRYTKYDLVTVTSDWQVAAKLLFWLPGKPNVYTLPCGAENQYADWSQGMMQQLKHKQITQVLYLDMQDHSRCIQKYFSYCTALPTLTHEKGYVGFYSPVQRLQLFAYRCDV